MIRSFALMAAAATMAMAPVTAQAAPPRAATPVEAEADDLRGNPFVVPVAIALIVALIILATSSGNDSESP